MLDLSTSLTTFPVLETQRLILREVTIDDADVIFAIMSDPQVMRYYGTPMHSHDEAVKRANSIRAAFQERNIVYWAITEKASNNFVGSGGFWRIIKPDSRAHIGYELAPTCWYRGFMTEAISAMVKFGFETIKLHSIEAGIHPDNIGSRRVLEKVGFVQEGYFREKYFDTERNCFIDAAVYSLLHSDWEQNSVST